MANTIKIKRGTSNSALADGELGFNTSTNTLYIGNGENKILGGRTSGRNLLACLPLSKLPFGSGDASGAVDSSNNPLKGAVSYDSGSESLHIINDNSNTRLWLKNIPVHAGETYVVSCWTASAETDPIHGEEYQFQINILNESGSSVKNIDKNTGNFYSFFHRDTLNTGWTWKVIYQIFTAPENSDTARIAFRTGFDFQKYTNNFFVKNFKVEQGSVYTEWTPAPEEMVLCNTPTNGEIYISKASGDAYFHTIRSDTGKELLFGIGSGGTNRGIYDITHDKWMFLITDNGISLGSALPISSGGTGATTAAGARTNLGVMSKTGDSATGDYTFSGKITLSNSNSSGNICLWADNEGGNLSIQSKSGTYSYQMDGNYDTYLRLISFKGNSHIQSWTFGAEDGKFSAPQISCGGALVVGGTLGVSGEANLYSNAGVHGNLSVNGHVASGDNMYANYMIARRDNSTAEAACVARNNNGEVRLSVESSRGIWDVTGGKWVLNAASGSTNWYANLYKAEATYEFYAHNSSQSGHFRGGVDGEGGYWEVKSKNGLYTYQFDAISDTGWRLYAWDNTANTYAADITFDAVKNRLVADKLRLTSAVDASETENTNVALTIGSESGQHLIIDNNEILSKTDASTTGDLYLQGLQIQNSGSIVRGTWNASTIGVGRGGTGATTAEGARTNLGAAAQWAEGFTPAGARNKTLTDLLQISLDSQTWNSYDYPCWVGTEGGGLTNCPVTGVFYAYREVRKISDHQIMVTLTEAYPRPGRVWTRTYDKNYQAWLPQEGWACNETIHYGSNAPTGILKGTIWLKPIN